MPTPYRLIAALLATLPLAGSAGQAQLLPAGAFEARDGRPGPGRFWTVTDAQGTKLAAAMNAVAAKTPIVIDYEHQTLHSEKNGQKSPAAGWVTHVEWQPAKGLFATVEWTAAAKAHIEAGEYRYISPVITFAADGQVTGVLLAALVNYPAILGMDQAIAELSGLSTPPNPQESHMDLLALLCTLFALPTGTTPEALMAKMGEVKAQLDETAALKAQVGKPDPKTMEAMAALQATVTTLTAQINGDKVTQMVDAALLAGKLIPAMRDWALDLGKKDIAQLQGYIDKAPVLGINQQQSGGKAPGDDKGGGNAALSAAAAEVIAKMGITPEQYAKAAPAAKA